MPDDHGLSGRIFKRIRGSLHDGPGMRTVIFFRGCPLRCLWCHNPESWDLETDPSRQRCECLSEAIDLSVQELTDYCLKDLPFYISTGGGVTFSGGEPLVQSRFLASVAEGLKQEGIHVAVDTSGDVSPEDIRLVIDHIDLWLFDIKSLEAKVYHSVTGGDLGRVLENLWFIDRTAHCRSILRYRLIPGINDTKSDAVALGELTRSLHRVQRIDVLPYHIYGIGKYRQLGIPYRSDILPESSMGQGEAELWVGHLEKETEVPVRLQ